MNKFLTLLLQCSFFLFANTKFYLINDRIRLNKISVKLAVQGFSYVIILRHLITSSHPKSSKYVQTKKNAESSFLLRFGDKKKNISYKISQPIKKKINFGGK